MGPRGQRMNEPNDGRAIGADASPPAHGPTSLQSTILLRLAASGATNREIARQLGCSERTIKRRIEEIATRLGARNRTQAVAIAIREGLI